ncbi:SCO family protein [Chitinophaga solisilvae]|uniref:SCO family protein n=1 Tax=Chitinophaga solisilvae TaxID=1233460 RepID=UPI00136BA310|nr:SCO family protein [Chitinophaga solisilvae]
MRSIAIWVLVIFIMATGCKRPEKRLPVLGEPTVSKRFAGGREVYDSVYPVVPPFSFIDQDGLPVDENSFAGNIYVADFIFLSCPAICPKMTAEMKRVYDYYSTEERIRFISHTIDPVRDSVPRLKAYALSLNINDKKWKFVTGNQDSIYHLAEKGYFSNAYKDSTAPGGYAHSGGLLLIDKNRHIRGVYDGTNKQETYRLIGDIAILLKEPS